MSVCLSISFFRQFVHLTDSAILSLYLCLSNSSMHLYVFLLHIYQSIKSIHLSMSVTPSIHLFLCIPSIGMPVSILYVSLHSPKLFFFHIFKKEHKIRQAQGFCFINKSLMHQCTIAQMDQCSNAPMHQCTNAHFFRITHFFC